ncbi:MAG: hypothetical protein WAQ27_02640 [Candidatus Microsaccharimonas sp.]
MPTPDVEHLRPVGRIHFDSEVYAHQSVIDETKALRALGFQADSLMYHATSSIALPSIAKHGALLSSKELIAAEEPIETGEITTPEGWLHRHNNGLDDVYASSSSISTEYAQTTGEHFPVLFGINSRMIEQRIWMDTGDGLRLGGRVALNAIAAQVTPFDKVAEVKEWAAENCPEDTVTLSLDAAFMLTYHLGYRS